MNDATMQAAAAMALALEAENEALRAMDVPRALGRFPQKLECSRQLRLAMEQPAVPADPARTAASRACGARLRSLAEDNRRLLERAMAVQGRLIATLVRAAPSTGPGYGPATNAMAVPAMTLSARA